MLSKAQFHTQFLIAIILLILLWVPAFITIEPVETEDFSFFGWCFGWIRQMNFVGVILTFFLEICILFLLYKTLTTNHLQSANTIFPEIVFVIFLSNISTMQLSPEIVAVFFLLLSLKHLYSIGEEELNDNSIFYSSFLIGVATLFYPAIWLCFLLPIVSVLILGKLSLRKIILSLLGFLLIWIWVGAVVFLTDSFSQFYEYMKGEIQFGVLQFRFSTDWMSLSLAIIELAIIIPVTIIALKVSQNDIVIHRRKLYVTFSMFILLVISFFTTNNTEMHHILLFLPETILIIYLYEHLKKVKMVGFLIFLIFLLNLAGRWMFVFSVNN